MKQFLNTLKEIRKYPAAIVGLSIVSALVIFAVVVVINIPYQEAINQWRGGEEIYGRNPRNVPPKWFNWFREDDLPESFELKEGDQAVTSEVNTTEGGTTIKTLSFTFDYNYAAFPQDVVFYFKSNFDVKEPFVAMTWVTPDEREIRLGNFGTGPSLTFPLSQDDQIRKKVDGMMPNVGLFDDPEEEGEQVLQGTYTVNLEAITFEPGSEINVEMLVLGQVHGWAGTDHLRRDLTLPIMWGAPIALTFGLLAALGTSVTTMIFAAIGAWYGGVVDGLIQRITEINLVLPFLSILIMVGTFYSRSIWTILGVTIALSIFTGGIKQYRAIFMQVKESTYIEAAQAYGAKDGRIIFRYLIPRIIPLLIPGLISAVPAFVFLEASLALLGIGDPVLPTWGKTINDAYQNAALYRGWYYWILEPAALLMITGLGFAMLGFSLDRIFNPRLRGL
ncbi:MAG TPA: ABC transporter permease [Brevefilum sp.]